MRPALGKPKNSIFNKKKNYALAISFNVFTRFSYTGLLTGIL